MGRNNQQRRAAKKRKRQRAGARRSQARRTGPAGVRPDGADSPHAGCPGASSRDASPGDRSGHDGFARGVSGSAQSGHAWREPPPVAEAVRAAAWSWGADPEQDEATLDTLSDRGGPARAAVNALLADTVANLWPRGWSPADVVHITARHHSPAHADVVAAVAVADGRERRVRGEQLHPRWVDQLAVLQARKRAEAPALDAGLRRGLDALSLLLRLPDVVPTIPAPGRPGAGSLHAARLDARMLARVQALLAKAESTDFDEEAEALTAKAQELIARHAIDEALLHTPGDVGQPSVRRVMVDNPYADAKAALLQAVAAANRCRCVYSSGFGWVTMFGYEHGLDAVELLHASLLAQATAAMARHGSRRDAHGRSRTRSFRRAFLYGFAARVGQRLREATDGQVDAAADTDRGRALPVLAARDDHLRAAVEEAFPHLIQREATVGNTAGWVAGTVAGDQAHLGAAAGAIRGRPT